MKSELPMQQCLALVVLLGLGIAPQLTSGQVLDNKRVDFNDQADIADQSEHPQRILDFRVYGLYAWMIHGAPHLRLTGEQVVSGQFFFNILYNGQNLKTQPIPSTKDQMSIKLTDLGHDSLEYAAVFIIYKHHYMGNESQSCSFPLRRMGKNLCNLTSEYYLAVVVSERIRLHGCDQSSDLTDAQGTFACNLAYDDEYSPPSSPTVSLSSCAITGTSHRPWWMAKAARSFQFERIELHSAAEFNQWTRNFRVSIEKNVCIDEQNGYSFVKKSFRCGAYGNWIQVVAQDGDVRLTICKLVAHGSPGGCGEIIQPRVDTEDTTGRKCERTLRGHFGLGKVPYPTGLNCQWTLAPPHKSARLMIQFPEFSTAGPQDYLAIYEGKGVRGKLLGKYYGKPGSGSAPPPYNKPGVFGAKDYLMSGNITNSVTVQFVTAPAKSRKAFFARNTESHRGFEIKFTIVKDDNFRDNGKSSDFNTPIRMCSIASYAEKLYTLCNKRGRINPVFLYGNVTGGQMLQALVSSNGKLSLPALNIELMEEKLGAVLFRIPEIEEDLTDNQVAGYCRTYKKPEVPPRYFDECCCRYCSPKYLSNYCMWDYGATDNCQLVTNRVGSEFSAPGN